MILVLFILSYMLLTMALQTLTCHAHLMVRRHNLVRASKIKRNEYLNSLLNRMSDEDETENETIEVLGNDDDDLAGPIAMPVEDDQPARMAA